MGFHWNLRALKNTDCIKTQLQIIDRISQQNAPKDISEMADQ